MHLTTETQNTQGKTHKPARRKKIRIQYTSKNTHPILQLENSAPPISN